MQFPPITVNKTIIHICVLTIITRMVAHTRLKILRATARYEWKVEDLTHAYVWTYIRSIRHYVASWNRAEVRMFSGTCHTINSHGQDYILNKYFSIIVAKYI